MKSERLGELEAVLFPSRSTETSHVVVLLHGFGAPGHDLCGIAHELRPEDGTAFVFPAAPHTFSDLYGAPPMVDARAWWKLDLERIERARRTGGVRDLSREHPEGLDEARRAVVSLLDAISVRYPDAKLTIGGFSQGAMLACDVALRDPCAFAKLVLLSGTLLCEDEWTALFPRLASNPLAAGTPVFQSHGTTDDVLPFSLAEKLRDGLRAAGVDVTFERFEAGHGIPEEVMESLATWLRR